MVAAYGTHAAGAVEISQFAATFRLYAPGKRRVSLVGDFNNWDPRADLLSVHDGLWQLEKALPPGRYPYGFDVDRVRIADPHARETEWEGTSGQSFVTIGEAPFVWRHPNFKQPEYQDLIIYEILVNDFTPEGTFEGVTARLDHLERLGINCIELMPVTSGPPHDNWGYHPVFYFAPNRRYGAPDDLRRLVDEAHGRGIAVILDVCLAHSGKEHPFLQLYEFQESPWYGEPFGGQNEFGLPSFEYSQPATQAFSREILHFWLREFQVDGFRLDYAKLIGEREGMGIPQLVRDIRELDPQAYIITEMLPEKPASINRWDVNGSWHESLQNALTDNLVLDLIPAGERKPEESWEHLLRALNPVKEDYCRADLCVNFVGNHDEERMMRVLMARGLNEDEALKRVLLVTTLVFCMAGPPLMFHGEEWGERTEKTLAPNPLHWDLLERTSGKRMLQHFRQLIALRRREPALRSAHVEVHGGDAFERTLTLRRSIKEPAADILIAANLATEARPVELNMSPGGWQEFFSGQQSEGGRLQRELPPFGAEIWIVKS